MKYNGQWTRSAAIFDGTAHHYNQVLAFTKKAWSTLSTYCVLKVLYVKANTCIL